MDIEGGVQPPCASVVGERPFQSAGPAYNPRMRFVTRCPACLALFEVRDEQLQACAGWLRCGQCFKAYDSTGLVLAWSSATASEAVLRVDIRTLLHQPDGLASAAGIRGAQALDRGIHSDAESKAASRAKAEPGGLPHVANASPPDQRAVPELPKSLRNTKTRSPGSADDGPPQIHQTQAARKRWPWGLACALAALLLAAQVLQAPLNSLQLVFPPVQRWGQVCCAYLGCTWPAIRASEAVHLDSARLIREEERLILHVRLRNAAPVDVVAGAIELSLLGPDGRVLLRRVLGPDALGAPAVLSGGAAWETRLLLRLDASSQVQGYRALWILP